MTRNAAPLRQPDVFDRTVYMIDEIHAASDELKRLAMLAKAERSVRDLERLTATSEKIEKLANQSKIMADAFARIMRQAKETR